jgi:hypothetical protein
MRKGGGKPKGNANERAEARRLSQWFYGDPNVLIRTQSSGAMATVRQVAIGLNDIMQLKRHDEPFPFCVELKHLKDPVLLGDLFRVKSTFRQAWTQCVIAADLTPGHEPLLIYRSNRHAPTASYYRGFAPTDAGRLLQPVYNPIEWADERGRLVVTVAVEGILTENNANRLRARFASAA